MAARLDQVVMAVAADLTTATAGNWVSACERALARVVELVDIDVGFLRHNDHQLGATRLVAEWPRRAVIPNPDPLATVFFAEADSVFALAANGKELLILRSDHADEAYRRRVADAGGIPHFSLACVPLLSEDVTTGALGFVRFGDRSWMDDEVRALQTIATLFGQLHARVLAEEQRLQLTDELTGLLQRSAVTSHLDDRLAAGKPGPVPAIVVNLDRLKIVNDSLGHDAGDQLIKAFAGGLRRAVDGDAVMARVRGGEFVVVPATPMSVTAAESFARTVHSRLPHRVHINAEMLTPIASVGVAVGEPGGVDATELLRRAEQALAAARRDGGGNIAVFTEQEYTARALRDDVAAHLQATAAEAADSALVLHYHPEVDLRTGEIVAVEALARWRHPVRGLLEPDALVEVAESTNQAGRLGRWVLRAACASISRWRSEGISHDIVLSVNVSPAQLLSEGFVPMVAGHIQEFRLQRAVRIEISERALALDPEATRDILTELHSAGATIAIDHFGTGHTTLPQLRPFPIDVVKLDRNILRGLGTAAGDPAVVRAVLAIADCFHLRVVAAGVETALTAEVLSALGCHRAQGLWLSEPLDATAVEAALLRGFMPLPKPGDTTPA